MLWILLALTVVAVALKASGVQPGGRKRCIGLAVVFTLGAIDAGAADRIESKRRRRNHPITAHFPFNTRGHSTWGIAGVPVLDVFGSDYTGGATFTPTIGAGVTFNKSGTVTAAQSTPFYPDSFGGANATGMLFDGASGFTAGDVLDQTGDLSICAVFWPQTTGNSTGAILIKDSGGTPNRNFWLRSNSTAAATSFTVFKADGTGSQINDSWTHETWNVQCVTYDFVTDGTSILRSNLNGVAPAEVTNAVGPMADGNAPLMIGDRSGLGTFYKGNLARISMWSQAFSAATLKQMVLAMLAELGSSGQQVAVTRATTETCQIGGDNGTIYTMANGVACINGDGLQVFVGATNTVIRSDELDNADWTVASGTPTVTAAAGASLYDTDTAGNVADSVEDNDGATAECIRAVARCGTTTGTYSASAYVKSMTGTTSATLRIVTDGTGTATCETTGLSTSAYTRIVCANKAITGTPTTNDFWICPGRQGTVADLAKILVFGAQCAASANVTPVIRTAGATVAGNVPNVSRVLTGELVDGQGQVCATVTFPSAWISVANTYLIDFTGTGSGILFSGTTTATLTDLGTNTNVTLTAFAGRTARICGAWGAFGKTIKEVGGASTTGTYDGTMVTGTTYIGSNAGSSTPLNSYVKDIRFCRGPGGCE